MNLSTLAIMATGTMAAQDLVVPVTIFTFQVASVNVLGRRGG